MEQYQNPMKVWGKTGLKLPEALPDPYVIRYLGKYYCYATGEKGIPVLRSSDLCQWEYLGVALSSPKEQEFWAPCAIYENGMFYLYYSSRGVHEEDCHCERLKVAVSHTPEGPFSYVQTLFPYFSIDPHVIKQQNGGFLLYYAENISAGCDCARPGTSISTAALETPLSIPQQHKTILAPSRDEEIFCKNRFGDGRHWHTLEGPFYFSDNGCDYLTYSGNAYTDEKYFVGYAVKNPQGDWEKSAGFSEKPLLEKYGEIEGTGHNCVVKAPNLVDSWMIYHGREISDKPQDRDSRQMRMDRLYIGEKELWCPGPTGGLAPIPARPQLFEVFSEEDKGLLKRWKVLEGDWKASESAVFQQSLLHRAGMVSAQMFENYLLEVSLKAAPSHLGNVYGIFLSYLDQTHYSALLLHSGLGAVILRKCVGHVCFEDTVARLSPDFDPFVWHTLLVERLKGKARIALDDKEIGWITLPAQAGCIGLATQCSKAYFTGITVTDYASLQPENQEEFLSLFSKSNNSMNILQQWKVKNGALVSTSFEEAGELCYQGYSKTGFQLKLRINLSPAGKLHIDIKDQEENKGCRIKIRKKNISVIHEDGTDSFDRIDLNPNQKYIRLLMDCYPNEISLYCEKQRISIPTDFPCSRWSLSGLGEIEIDRITWLKIEN